MRTPGNESRQCAELPGRQRAQSEIAPTGASSASHSLPRVAMLMTKTTGRRRMVGCDSFEAYLRDVSASSTSAATQIAGRQMAKPSRAGTTYRARAVIRINRSHSRASNVDGRVNRYSVQSASTSMATGPTCVRRKRTSYPTSAHSRLTGPALRAEGSQVGMRSECER